MHSPENVHQEQQQQPEWSRYFRRNDGILKKTFIPWILSLRCASFRLYYDSNLAGKCLTLFRLTALRRNNLAVIATTQGKQNMDRKRIGIKVNASIGACGVNACGMRRIGNA